MISHLLFILFLAFLLLSFGIAALLAYYASPTEPVNIFFRLLFDANASPFRKKYEKSWWKLQKIHLKTFQPSKMGSIHVTSRHICMFECELVSECLGISEIYLNLSSLGGDKQQNGEHDTERAHQRNVIFILNLSEPTTNISGICCWHCEPKPNK